MFTQANLCEDMGDLWYEPDHQVWKWNDGDLYVSMTRRGPAMFCHFYAKPQALRSLKQIIEEFCTLAFSLMPWCAAIMASVKLGSVARLVKKCGFEHVISHKQLTVFARYR